jgi:Lon protease-like protein
MMGECLEEHQPFGVALIKRGKEVGEAAVPHRIGTSAIISQATERPDGRLDIVAIGYQRFRILSLSHDRPYLSGLVETLPPIGEDSDEAHAEAALLRPPLREYIHMLGEATESEIELDQIPEKPTLLAFLTAILLQVPKADKQSLLATEAIPEMLSRERRLLLRERQLLQANIGAEFTLDAEKIVFSTS